MRLRRLGRSGIVAAVRVRPARGGYESSGEPITELPRVPSGPAPGARPGPWQVEPDVSVRAPLPPDPPERPHPAANAWPDDAVTVTYPELRRLVALHLDYVAHGMPHAEPWAWVRERAGTIRDGEAPLLLSEVMEP